MKKIRVLIGVPTYDGKEYCLDYWARRLKKIVKKSPFKTDVLIVDNSETSKYARLIRKYGFKVKKIKRKKEALESLANSRRVIFESSLKGEYDFLFSLEQDVIPPGDIIKKLYTLRKSLKDRLAIVGSPYIVKAINKKVGKKIVTKDYLTSAADGTFWYKPYKSNIQNLIPISKIPKNKLMRCFAIGMGCTLIDIGVLREIQVEYVKGIRKPDDSYFYVNCEKKKISVYCANKLLSKMLHFKGSTYSQESW